MNDVNESTYRTPPPGDWPTEDLERLGQCPVCTSIERSLLYENLQDKIFFSAPGAWKMGRCAACGAGYLDPRPTIGSIGRAYDNYYTHGDWQPGSGPLPGGNSPIKRVWHGLRNDYLNAYPLVKRFMEDTKSSCKRIEHVRTICGRYRRLPGINYRDDAVAAYAERQAVNSIIQGSAADTILVPMIQTEFDPRLRELECDLLLQIHDELVFEVPEEHAEEAAAIITEIMENPYDEALSVALPIDLHIVNTWGEGK